jgi:hypothetical protein
LRRANWFLILLLLLQAQVIAVRLGKAAHTDQRGPATAISTLCSPDRLSTDRLAHDDCAGMQCALNCENGHCNHPIIDSGHDTYGYSRAELCIPSIASEIVWKRPPLCGVIVGARAPPLFS